MPVVPDILASWRRPRAVIARKLADGVREDRAIATVMGACGLIFVAQWPGLAREAHLTRIAAEMAGTPLDQVPSLQALMGARLLALVFIAPLVFYALAAASHLVARLFGGRGTGFGARMALFWALFCTTPAILLQGLVGGFLGAGAAATVVGLMVLALFLYLWVNMLIEAERHAADGR
ncbi:YIP1 family protein [Rhodobacteraceae bacterium HSP-20]|uniref:YIP1 family protein n=1 Tax=Paragemmobacter amnigenus TaxID=2852097 RepID=A0ABS6J567_9RHOB|nr:YIP1 family protein [Rhodobacter amnigenus]MBU9698386.1 YIP1 family protein [Rhodobacter amnigenus]MBV4389613.1 YIP1 family protein [Rhodobacter amnigenus]